MIRNIAIVVLVFLSSESYGQKLKKEDRALISNLQKHVVYLSDDKLEGRRTGTGGEKQAAAYIATEFQKAGLAPMGTNGYFQEFSIYEGKRIDESTSLSFNGETLKLHEDFFPLAYSANGKQEAAPSLALQESGMPWFLDLHELLDEGASNPHFDLQGALIRKVKSIRAKGASALFVYNSSDKEDRIIFDAKDRSPAMEIPVVYIKRSAAKKFFSDASAELELQLQTQITEVSRTGSNVIGFVNNRAATTIIIGAHFDHLGYGEDGNSREVSLGAVHNGADDNASGTAAIIELAGLVRLAKLKKHNYLFIGFSGEELGLYGSKYFTENPTIELAGVNYMVNLDMVGRLNAQTKTLTVGGYGTSPSWGQFYKASGKKGLYASGIQFKFDSSGTGPSDHTSFYRKNIPVLFYFTGLHSDYHKPTDDHDKINYEGQLHLVKHVFSLLEATEKKPGKIAFSKTREVQTNTSARFSVSLGIMPDYTYSGNGIRVDGVIEGRAAHKAGLQPGDIVTALGNTNVSSMEAYMQALSRFNKGDKTSVTFSRKNQVLSTAVEF